MALNTTFCFMLLSVALLLLPRKGSSRTRSMVASCLAALTAATGMASFIGYASRLSRAYGWLQLSAMAVHTAVGFVLLGSALMLHAYGSHSTLNRQTRWLALPLSLAMLMVTGTLWQALLAEQQSMDRGSWLPQLVLVFGLLFTAALAAAVYLAQTAQRRALESEDMARALQQEIEDRKRAEAGREQLAAILEVTTDFVSTAAPDGRTLYLNRAGRRIRGIGAGDDLAGMHISAHHPAWAYEKLVREAIPSAQRERVWNGETALLKGDGSELPVSQMVLAHSSADGTQYISTIARDISQQKCAEQELGRLNHALLALSRCNEAMVRATSESELLKTICEIIVRDTGYRLCWVGWALEDTDRNVVPVAWAGVEDGYMRTLNVNWADTPRGRGPTGTSIRESRPVHVNCMQDDSFGPWQEAAQRRGYRSSLAVPLRDEQRAFGALAIYAAEENAFDEQEIKLLAQLGDNLAFGVRALRARLEREQHAEALAQSQRELQRRNAELQDFASVASHDLQEPLRKVISFGERLREHAAGQLDPLGLEFLGRMQNATSRMSHLIDALLQYSRLTTRAQPFQRVDLTVTALQVISDLEARMRESHARVEVAQLPILEADATQMRQLLQNLVANALKFRRPDSSPCVQVESARVNNHWEITVADNGIGFEEKYAERLFRPFQRLHSRSEFEGSGMGLAICRRIVERHGGNICVHSKPGEGSKFVVKLPATLAKETYA